MGTHMDSTQITSSASTSQQLRKRLVGCSTNRWDLPSLLGAAVEKEFQWKGSGGAVPGFRAHGGVCACFVQPIHLSLVLCRRSLCSCELLLRISVLSIRLTVVLCRRSLCSRELLLHLRQLSLRFCRALGGVCAFALAVRKLGVGDIQLSSRCSLCFSQTVFTGSKTGVTASKTGVRGIQSLLRLIPCCDQRSLLVLQFLQPCPPIAFAVLQLGYFVCVLCGQPCIFLGLWAEGALEESARTTSAIHL